MTHPSEPSDVGPIVGGDLRASDADRDQVIGLLSAAYSEGRLTLDEHEERVAQAQEARTFDDLVPLTRDLVPIGAPLLPAPAPAPAAVPSIRPVGGTSAPITVVGIMGGSTRKGHWRVPSVINVYALMGGATLDMTEAEFETDHVTINAYCCMGGLEIKVPAGVTVNDQTVGIMGGNDVKHTVAGDGPLITLKGVALMGGSEVRGPGKEIERERRRERRRLERGR